MYWVIATILIFTLIIWTFSKRKHQYWINQGVPQTSPWILLGDTWPTIFRLKDLTQWMKWIYYMHPKSKYVGIYQFYTPVLMLKDPELIKQIAVKDFDHFTDHNSFTVDEEVDPLWGKNLFALKGQKWHDMRGLLSGSFTSSKMRIMYSLIAEESEKFVNYFLKKGKDVIDLELKDSFTRYTNDVIASTSFGIKVNSLENQDNEFFLMGKEASNFSGVKALVKFIGAMVCPWLFKVLKIGFISTRVQTFFCRIIDETIKMREEQEITRPDMINLLLEIRKGTHKVQENEIPDSGFAVVQESPEIAKSPKKQVEITNLDIASQALIFFLAGFDSVATAMCFTCYELAINPDVQDKLRKKIKDVFQQTNGEPTYEDILKIKYLDMVITEALRMWPVAPAADRVCVKPYTLLPSHPGEPTITFKKNDILWIPIYNIHHDPQYYPDPDKFIPERFSEENKGNIQPYTYLPFGTGPRGCIGSRFALLEIKSVLFHLLNHFEIVPSEKTQIPLRLNKVSINFDPEGGFPLRLKQDRINNTQTL